MHLDFLSTAGTSTATGQEPSTCWSSTVLRRKKESTNFTPADGHCDMRPFQIIKDYTLTLVHIYVNIYSRFFPNLHLIVIQH